MKIVTVIGARPQFVKAAVVSSVLRETFTEVLVHTGQHYDPGMSDVFFQELGIPRPDHALHSGSGEHGAQTSAMLTGIENILIQEKPDYVLVYGDTNSTLAGALAASKLLVPVIHIEAGLRSFNKAMPEEQNRIITDHVAALLFAPTQTAVENLRNEGITQGVAYVGDVMYDAVLHFSGIAETRSRVLDILGLERGKYMLCTIHRAGNTNYIDRMKSILEGLAASGEKIILPLHPRTQKYLDAYGLTPASNIQVTGPVGYLDMLMLQKHAKKIVTDSGGMQKEAYFFGKPCITLRDETEWVETISTGCNILVGAESKKIAAAMKDFQPTSMPKNLFGDGNAAQLIVGHIKNHQG